MGKLPKHVQIYIDFFGKEEGDWIECEITEGTCIDVHHITPKKMGGSKTFFKDGIEYDIDDIINLIGVTREAHIDCHDEIYTKRQLYLLHAKRMRNYLLQKQG